MTTLRRICKLSARCFGLPISANDELPDVTNISRYSVTEKFRLRECMQPFQLAL